MAIDKDIVPRETPPLRNLGPLLTLDINILEAQLKSLSEKDRNKFLHMLSQCSAVMLKNGGLNVK